MPYRIVLVEDHAMLREALELMLGRHGCEVVGTASRAGEGAELVERLDPDVAVIDVGLGPDSGIALAARLLSADPGRRIVLYTGSDGVDLLLRGLESGAQGYALKEGGSDELMDAITAVAEGGTYVDPRLKPVLAAQRRSERHASLSARERQIVQLLADGLTSDEVAARLFLSSETVKTHVRNAMAKLHARNRVHAIAIALRAGEIRMPEAA